MIVDVDGDSIRTSSHSMPRNEIPCAEVRFLRAASIEGQAVQVAVCAGVRIFKRSDFELVKSRSIAPEPVNK